MTGILIGLYTSISIAFFICLFMITCLLFFLWFKKTSYILFLLFILLGFLAIYYSEKDFVTTYREVYDSDEVCITGVVLSPPEDKEYKYRYTVQVSKINDDTCYKGTKLFLDFKKKNNTKGGSYKETDIPTAGDEIEFSGRIESPKEARNYKGFDYKAYLKGKGIYGIVETTKVKTLSKNNLSAFQQMLQRIQRNIKQNMESILGKEEAGLCIGILIGSREGITEETENHFQKSNLTHLLAVSGSHITYIITAFATVLGKTSKKITQIGTILFLLFFMALTGYTASVMRASIMGILVLVAGLLHRKSDTINNLGISSFLLFLLNPYTITDLGFLLSYAGTMGIILLGEPITNKVSILFHKFFHIGR